jgi:hypothetical protein
MPHIFLDDEKVEVRLCQTDSGVRMYLDGRCWSLVCELKHDGTLELYANVNENLQRTKKHHYIKVVKEMDK